MQEKEYPNTIFNKNDNTYHKVDEIEELYYEGTVYNLNVQGNHTYVCNAGLVNNCHPRDNIAMSWLADELNTSHNLFEDIMQAREDQAFFIARYIIDKARESNKLPIVLLGKAFKPETKIKTGSPAMLVANILKANDRDFVHLDHVESPYEIYVDEPAVFAILTKHECYKNMAVSNGSIVIDPFGYYKTDNPTVKVYNIGRKS